MANFHTNNLVIAASEANMQKVLVRFAQNLAANSDNTGFSISSIEGMTSVSSLYSVICGEIDAYYWLSFCGAPIDREVAEAGAESWGAHPENEAYLSSISTASGKLTGGGDGVTIGISMAPTGRPMSETANVSCTSYGDNWVLKVGYDTAWRANSDDIDLFFMGLPEGDYGVAFLDADEYDNYESVSAFSGLHHGRAGMREAEIRRDEVLGIDERKREKKALSMLTRSLVNDLAELADIVGICEWSSGWEDDECDSDGCEDECDSFDAFESWDTGINWNNPTKNELMQIDNMIVDLMRKFPLVVGSTGAAYEGRERNVERVVPGQPIKLVSDWINPYFSPVAIQTQTATGERLGNLDDRGGGMMMGAGSRAALACILPHLRAYADKVEPLMILDARKRNTTLIVRIELTDEPLEHIFEEAHALLGLKSNQRSVSSVVEWEE